MQTNRAAILCYLGEALNRDSKKYDRILIVCIKTLTGKRKAPLSFMDLTKQILKNFSFSAENLP